MDDDTEHKKAKGTKQCVIKREFMFENYTDCLVKGYLYYKTILCHKAAFDV